MNTPYTPDNGGSLDLSKIKAHYIASVHQTLCSLGADDAAKVRAQLLKVVGGMNASYMFSPDFILQASADVFGDEVFRDWLYNTRFVFFMNLASAYGQQMVGFVVDNIARSASIDLGAEEFLEEWQKEEVDRVNTVPGPIRQELLTYDAAKTALVANTWLIVIMLAIAFLDLDAEVLRTPQAVPQGRRLA